MLMKTTQPTEGAERAIEAVVIFVCPEHAKASAEEFTARGFGVELLDWIDEGGTSTWLRVTVKHAGNDDEFTAFVKPIVESVGGDLDVYDIAGSGVYERTYNVPVLSKSHGQLKRAMHRQKLLALYADYPEIDQ
jgi:hypothetical protein